MTKKLFIVLSLFIASIALVACNNTTTNAKPTFSGVGDVTLAAYETFNPLTGVTATDTEDGSLTSVIWVKSNNVNTNLVGTYSVVYQVTDSSGNVTTVTRTVTVVPPNEEDYPLAQYLSGVDLSKLPADDKGILFAAAERYLLENVYAGVPLYTGASRVIYSDRVQLYSPEYNGVLGFGTAFSQLTEDDSNVYMYGTTYGVEGEYTWRSSFSTDPTGLNPWMADDSNTSDFTDLFNGALYDFYFDETKKSFKILPSLAAAEPVPVDPVVINGKTYAKIWRIQIKDNLQWKFHPDTDVSGLPAGYQNLDASDYLWTWEYALTHKWFRARTGGGDFISQGIKNAAEFIDGSAEWSEVGIRMAEGTTDTIELEYINSKSTFEIKYGFAGAVLTPVCQELYEALGADYGKTPADVASSGIYYLDTWTPGQLLTYKKNTLHPDSALYHYTGYQFRFISGSETIFQEFLAGRLESASIPSSQVPDYASDPRVKTAPDPTTWRLMINGFGTEAVRDAYIAANPGVGIDDTWVPEPILSYLPMRQALMYGFNRYYACVDLVKTYLPAATLFTSTYFLDGDSAIGVRETDAGAAIVTDFSGQSYGYYPDAAVDLFKEAVAAAIADEYYVAGTADNYTVITLQLYWASSGSTSAQMMVSNLKEQYERLLVDDVNFVKIVINLNDVAFPGNYYDYMMIAKMDLGIGGISGSLLDAPSFLDVFCDDSRGGFTLNWGIDTSTPNIPIAYHNLDGNLVFEKWSYNALVEAITGRIYIKDGVEQAAWTNAQDLINAYLDMSGEVLETSSDGNELGGYVLGDTLANIAVEEGFDELNGFIIVTESGKNILFVVSKDGLDYKLYNQSSLFTTAEDAIQDDLNAYGYTLVEATKLDDAGVAANAYIHATYPDYTTIAIVADDLGIPVEYTEVWAISRTNSKGVLGADGYVLLHIGNYYIAVMWL